MPTQKRSGGVSITPYQALNCRMSGTSTGRLEGNVAIEALFLF